MSRLTAGSEPTAATVDIEHSSRIFFALTLRVMTEVQTSVSATGLRALLVLEDHDARTLGDLAELVPLSQSATSRMVERLVGEGLVRRDQVAGDRRQRSLTLTPKGRALTRDLVRRRRAAIGAVATGMAPRDVERLRSGLEAFTVSAHAAAR